MGQGKGEDAESPFAALAALRGQLPPGPPAAEAKRDAPPAAPRAPARAVVRMQRKGYGGKTVTLVEKLELSAEALDDLLKRLKTQLGLGGRRDGELLVLQGDCRDRVAEALNRLGVKKVTTA